MRFKQIPEEEATLAGRSLEQGRVPQVMETIRAETSVLFVVQEQWICVAEAASVTEGKEKGCQQSQTEQHGGRRKPLCGLELLL